MQPLWTDESELLLRVVETDPDWIAVADSFSGNKGYDTKDGRGPDPLCPECGTVWTSIYMKIWQRGDFTICIDTFDCEHSHRWTRSTGPHLMSLDDES
ncbi:hypothetical protein [Mycobacterium conspicuum]|uniref:Uncharacterized protein n=1 Tax=Mycobacterium conspicuum TaxID=44010 RepID=A0A1X1T6S6_9MYCO|nr:hypothetical protein [Mycobacterium conspicuum]ORV40219.1 hypothetical protein AWC00_16255 [Mycobacterium conspicuum]BBZ37100.1 hypothetical protein MCNS_01630 [Mycobacterium conspicuum]